MKTILLPIHDDAGQTSRIAAALSLARTLGGHILCFDLLEAPQLFADYVSGAGRAMLLDDEQRRASVNHERVDARLTGERVSFGWTTASDKRESRLADGVDLADIIVVSRDDEDRVGVPLSSLLMPGKIRHKPILSVDAEQPHFKADGRAMAVWDGTEQAASVLRTCIPLLCHASAVEIFAVECSNPLVPPEEAAEYLSRHGIVASIAPHPADNHALEEWLDIRCVMWRADYCVLGTFVGEGVGDHLFASTTRRLLRRTRLPVITGG